MVPANTLATVEAAKMAALGGDLSLVSMLGATQRDWWKTTMSQATSTWKLWGNEVSLLRMGLSGTDAIATLIALNSIASTTTNIVTASGSTSGNMPPQRPLWQPWQPGGPKHRRQCRHCHCHS